MKVALILCPFWDAEFAVYSLASLSAQLRGRGHEVVILDLNATLMHLDNFRGERTLSWSEPNPEMLRLSERFLAEVFMPSYRPFLEEAIDSLLSQGVRMAAFSVTCNNKILSSFCAQLFKTRDRSVITVFGGPQCLTLDECISHLRGTGVDAVVYGEADRSFPDFVDTVERHGSPRPLPGILLGNDPATWKTGPGEVVRNLDDLPLADYSGYKKKLYQGLVIHTTRGCVRRCVFCSDWRGMNFRRMSPRRVFDEMRHQSALNPEIKKYMFGDSLLNSSIKDLSALCEHLIGAELGVSWGGYAIVRPEMGGGLLERMRRAGCSALIYGIETGSAKISSDMNKNVLPETNALVLRETSRAGLAASTGWMVGFPTETQKEFRESLDFLEANHSFLAYLGISLVSIHEMSSENMLCKYNIENTHRFYWKTRDGSNTFPIRVARAKETAYRCLDLGIPFGLEGKAFIRSSKEVDAYFELWLEDWAQWEKGGSGRN